MIDKAMVHILSGYRTLCRLSNDNLWPEGHEFIFFLDIDTKGYMVDCGECLAVAAAYALGTNDGRLDLAKARNFGPKTP